MSVIVDYAGGIIEIRLTGRVAGSELLSQLWEVLEIEKREATTPDRLVDLREMDATDVKFTNVIALAEHRRTEALKNSIKSAFVVKTNVQFGIARTFQSINDNPRIAIRVFRDEAEARAWLAEDVGEHQTP